MNKKISKLLDEISEIFVDTNIGTVFAVFTIMITFIFFINDIYGYVINVDDTTFIIIAIVLYISIFVLYFFKIYNKRYAKKELYSKYLFNTSVYISSNNENKFYEQLIIRLSESYILFNYSDKESIIKNTFEENIKSASTLLFLIDENSVNKNGDLNRYQLYEYNLAKKFIQDGYLKNVIVVLIGDIEVPSILSGFNIVKIANVEEINILIEKIDFFINIFHYRYGIKKD